VTIEEMQVGPMIEGALDQAMDQPAPAMSAEAVAA